MHIKRKFTAFAVILAVLLQTLAFTSMLAMAAPPYTVVVDLNSSGYMQYGEFSNSPTLPGYEGNMTRYGHSADACAEFNPVIEATGIYKVYYWNVVHASNDKQLLLEVCNNGDAIGSYVLDQTQGEPGFVEIGEFLLQKGGGNLLRATPMNGGFVRTSAAKFELVREVDDTGALVAYVPQETSPYYDSRVEEVTLPVKDVTINEPAENCMKLYVATNGSDNAAGTLEAPLASLLGARNRIREIKKNGMPSGGITVYVRGGTYLFNESLTFTEEDSGTADAIISYRAYPGEKVTLCGGYAMDSAEFKPVTDEDVLRRVPKEAREHLLVYDMNIHGDIKLEEVDYSSSTKLPSQLIVNGEAMSVARWPNVGWATSGEVIDAGSRPDDGPRKRGFTIEYDDPRPERWTEAENAWLYGFWLLDYGASYTKIVNIDRDKNWISGQHYTRWGCLGYKRFYAINLLEEIDIPGEWFLSTETGKLYIWPKDGFEGSMPILSNLEGTLIDIDSAQHLLFRDLIIEGTRGNLVELNGKNNLIAGCTIRNSGYTGVVIGGYNNGLRDSEIYNTGRYCVEIGGGDRVTLTPGNNYIDNCDIHHSGRIQTTACCVTFYNGVGNRLTNSYVHDSPAQGVCMSKVIDCVMEYNQLDIISTMMADSGGVYTTLEQTNYGNIVRYNLIRDVMGLPGAGGAVVVGLYFDAASSGVTVYGNTVVGSDVGMLVNGGREVNAYNNVLIDCEKEAIMIWDLVPDLGAWFSAPNGTAYLDVINSPYKSELWRKRWPNLYIALEDSFGHPKYTKVMNNIGYNVGDDVVLHKNPQQYATIVGNKVYTENPGFDETGYRLKDDSVVYQDYPDFEKINYDNIGLYRGGLRTQETAKVYRMSLNTFNLTYPVKGSVNVDPQNVNLQWDLVDGSSMYKIYIATDAEFKDIIAVMQSQSPTVDVSGLLPYDSTIYWRVEVEGMRDVPARWNTDGVSSFTTISMNEKKELLETEAAVALEDAVEGTEEGQYPAGSIAALQTAISETDDTFSLPTSTEFQKKYALKCLKDAVDTFCGSAILPTDEVIICYDDFETDVTGALPSGFTIRSTGKKAVTANVDPADSANKVTLFNDVETGYVQFTSRAIPYGGKITLNCRVYGESTDGEFTVKLAKKGQEAFGEGSTAGRDRYLGKVTFGRDGNIYVSDRTIGTYEAKRWYNIKMCVDAVNDTYDLYIDGVLKADDVPVHEPFTDVGLMIFATGDSAVGKEAAPVGNWYLDDIIVTSPVDNGKSTIANGAVINGKAFADFMPDRHYYSVGEDISSVDLNVAENSKVTLKDSKITPGAKIAIVESGNGRNISSYMFRP